MKEVGFASVPYVSQILEQEKEDHKRSGFENEKDALDWQHRICGIACLSMALSGFSKEGPSLKELLDLGLERSAYIKGVGWKHEGLAELASSLGLKNSSFGSVESLEEIVESLRKGSLVVASVAPGLKPSWGLKKGVLPKRKRTGHLVLVYKARINGKDELEGFVIQDPGKRGKEFYINKKDFEKVFSGRIIELRS